MDTNSIMMSLNDKLPKEPSISMQIRDSIDKMSDEQRKSFSNKLLTLSLKNPTVCIVLAVFLGGFGVDRFYLKDMKMGIIKLCVMGILPIILNVIVSYLTMSMLEEMFLNPDAEPSTGLLSVLGVITTILYIGLFIWWLVDVIFASKRARKYNHNQILSVF